MAAGDAAVIDICEEYRIRDAGLLYSRAGTRQTCGNTAIRRIKLNDLSDRCRSGEIESLSQSASVFRRTWTVNDWISPFVLEAMTLRGLGSYLHGARLEIRPLTILCGTNGSGKSTWFRMLRILQDSLERGTLPFSLEGDIGCGEDDFHDHINPLVRVLDQIPPIPDHQQRPIGISAHLATIGLHVKSVATFQLATRHRRQISLSNQQDAPPAGFVSRVAAALLPFRWRLPPRHDGFACALPIRRTSRNARRRTPAARPNGGARDQRNLFDSLFGGQPFAKSSSTRRRVREPFGLDATLRT